MSASCTDASMTDRTSSEEVCRDFLRKVCTRGSNCKFRHPRGSEKKHEFCRDFQKSVCHRPSCKFIHCSADDEQYYKETGQLPPDLENGEKIPVDPERSPADKDIPLCKDFMSGACKRGFKCKYRHRSIGDIEFEDRLRNTTPYAEPWLKSPRESPREASPFDEYGYDLARRRIAPEPSYYPTRQSRYDEYGGSGGSSYYDYSRPRTLRDFEEENNKLLRKVEDLRKQVDDLTVTNDVLLEQNARLRAVKTDMSAVLLAESHLIRTTSPVTPAQVHLTAATAGAVPYPARVAAAAPTAQVATATPTAQVITAEIQALPASAAGIPTASLAGGIAGIPTASLAGGIATVSLAGGIPTASMPSAMTQVQSSVPPTVCVTSSMMTFPLATLRNVANMSNVSTVSMPNVATVNVAPVPQANRLGPSI